MPRKRATTPPRALPLVAISFVAILVGLQTLSVLQALATLAGFGDSRGDVVAQTAIDIVVLVALSLLLRLLIRRWVAREPPA